MSKYCVSLEVAQKLQKAGYHQKKRNTLTGVEEWNSDYLWVETEKGMPICVHISEWEEYGHENTICIAPTATQLAEELPDKIKKGDVVYFKTSYGIYHCGAIQDGEDAPDPDFMAKSLPDALGLMMVYLLENKLI